MTTRRCFAALLALVLMPLSAAGTPAEAADEFSRDHVPHRLSVRLHAGASEGRVHQRAGTTVIRRLRAIHTEIVAIDRDQDLEEVAARYRQDPDVASVQPVFIVRPYVIPNDPRFDEQWAHNNTGQTGGTFDADIDAPQGWDVTTSTPVHVAVIDTGFNRNHPDLSSNFEARIAQGSCPSFISDCDHATLIAGVAGAVGNNGVGVAGVAWDIPLLDVEFDFTDAGVAEAFMDVADYAQSNGVKVVATAAFGAEGSCPDKVQQAVDYARARGVLITAAAGNEGTDNDRLGDWPSGCAGDNVISVTSTNDRDALASFANFGPSLVDIAAPGVDILTTDGSSGYDSPDGTSISAPIVAGAAALVWGQNPQMSHSQVRQQLLNTVDKLSSLSGRIASGGRLNLARALGGTVDQPNPGTPPPTSGAGTGSVTGTTFGQGGGLFSFFLGGGGPQPTGGVRVRADNRSDLSEPDGDYAITGVPAGETRVTATRTSDSAFGGTSTVECSADSQGGPTSKTVTVPADGSVEVDWFCPSGGGFGNLFGGFGNLFGGFGGFGNLFGGGGGFFSPFFG